MMVPPVDSDSTNVSAAGLVAITRMVPEPPGPLSRAVRDDRSISLIVNVMSFRVSLVRAWPSFHSVETPGPERHTNALASWSGEPRAEFAQARDQINMSNGRMRVMCVLRPNVEVTGLYATLSRRVRWTAGLCLAFRNVLDGCFRTMLKHI